MNMLRATIIMAILLVLAAGAVAHAEMGRMPIPDGITVDSLAQAFRSDRRRLVQLEMVILASTRGSDDEAAVAGEGGTRHDSFAYMITRRGRTTTGHGRAFTLSEDRMKSALAALRASQRVGVILSPRILTLDNVAASFDMGTNWQQVVDPEDYPFSHLQIEATSHINPDSSVTITLSLAAGYAAETGSVAPENILTVEEGQTLIIDGVSDGKTGLIIFMTPRIILEKEIDTVAMNQAIEEIMAGYYTDLNSATMDQLRLIGFDELGARLVIAYRNRNGNYSSVAELLKVSGIPMEMYNRVKDRVTVDSTVQRDTEVGKQAIVRARMAPRVSAFSPGLMLQQLRQKIDGVSLLAEADLTVSRLSGHYADPGPTLRRHHARGLAGSDLYLYPDHVYLHLDWADIMPPTIVDKGCWEIADGFIVLQSDSSLPNSRSPLDHKYLPLTLADTVSTQVFLMGTQHNFAYFLDNAERDPLFMLLLCSRESESAITRAESAGHRDGLMRESWRPEWFGAAPDVRYADLQPAPTATVKGDTMIIHLGADITASSCWTKLVISVEDRTIYLNGYRTMWEQDRERGFHFRADDSRPVSVIWLDPDGSRVAIPIGR